METTYYITADHYYTNTGDRTRMALRLKRELPHGWRRVDVMTMTANRTRFLIAGDGGYWTADSVANLLRQIGLDTVEIVGRVADASKLTVTLARRERVNPLAPSNRNTLA